ncbi:hypothetical protein D3C77_548750 [compost metagenome]
MHAQVPGSGEGDDDHHLADQPGGLGRQAVDQHAHGKAQDRPGQDRRGHHQAPLLCTQLQIGGNLHRQRAKQVPDHEAEVEVQERGEQRGHMPGFPEAGTHRTPHSAMQRNEKDAATRSTGVEGRATSLSGSSGQPPLATGDICSARDGPTLRSCCPLVGAALCRDGLRSSPGNLPRS